MSRIDLTANIKLAGAKNLEYGEVEVVISSNAFDRHGEQIIVNGINTKQFMENPVVLWAHDYEGTPLGSVTKLWKSGGRLMGRIKFATEIVPFAKTVYDLIREGVLNAVSIGGIVREYAESNGTVDYANIAKMDMIELSVVPVGANPEALVTAKSLNTEQLHTYHQFIEKHSHKDLDKIIRDHIDTTKNLLSALESLETPQPETMPSKQIHRKRLVLGEKRKIARTVKTIAEDISTAINSELKRIHK